MFSSMGPRKMLPAIVRRMDWKTTARDASYRTHWRIYLPVAVCSATGFGIVHLLYPNAFWFFVLWCGGVMGQAAGLVAGVIWQLASDDRVPRTSGRFIVLGALISALFVSMAILVQLPLLRAQESERAAFRALAAQDVVSIVARGP